jgi:hypothetical protein
MLLNIVFTFSVFSILVWVLVFRLHSTEMHANFTGAQPQMPRGSLQPRYKRWNGGELFSLTKENGDPEPKLHMTRDEWEFKFKEMMDKPNIQMFEECKENLRPPLDDPDDQWFICRFLSQDIPTIHDMIKYLQSIGITIYATVDEFFVNRRWARLCWLEARTRVTLREDSWIDICGRAAIQCRLGNFWNQAQINKHLQEYIARKNPDSLAQWDQAPEQKLAKLVVCKPMENAPITLKTINQFMKMPLVPQRRHECVVCPGLVLMLLGIKICTTPAPEFAQATGHVKFGNVKTWAPKVPVVLFNCGEINSVLSQEDGDSKQSGDSIVSILRDQQNKSVSLHNILRFCAIIFVCLLCYYCFVCLLRYYCFVCLLCYYCFVCLLRYYCFVCLLCYYCLVCLLRYYYYCFVRCNRMRSKNCLVWLRKNGCNHLRQARRIQYTLMSRILFQ